MLGNFFDDPDRTLSDPFITDSDNKGQLDVSAWLYQPQNTMYTNQNTRYDMHDKINDFDSHQRSNNFDPHERSNNFDAHDRNTNFEVHDTFHPRNPNLQHISSSSAHALPTSTPTTNVPYNPAPAVEEAHLLEPPAHAPADVLDAAATLRTFYDQQRTQSQTHMSTREVEQPLYPIQQPYPMAATTPVPTRQRSLSQFTSTTAPSASYNPAYYPTMNGDYRASLDSRSVHGSSNFNVPARNSYPTHTSMYRFGSDNNFNPSGYTAPLNGMDNMHSHLEFARTIGLPPDGVDSAESSVPQSPVMNRHDNLQQRTTFAHYPDHLDEYEERTLDQPKPKRRRKTKSMPMEETSLDIYNVASPAFNNQSSPEMNNVFDAASPEDSIEDMPTGSGRKRRKSSSAAQARANALARKNLTEEQKRENHIKSEQKRRNIIKEGYRELNELVPNLKQGGFSKSAVLTETVRELEGLQAGNAQMEEFLTSMKKKLGAIKATG